jgi:hypothetical protein
MPAIDGRVAAPATRPIRQGIAPRTATVGLYVADSPLQRRLVELVAQGEIVPCFHSADDPHAPDRKTRIRAEMNCPGCSAFVECGEAGDSEQWGVWAGVDRTPGYAPAEVEA